MEIPQTRIDYLAQLAQVNGIPLEDLKGWYTKKLAAPEFASFPTPEALMDYLDGLLVTHIQEFHSAKLTPVEFFVVVSTYPRVSKQGSSFSSHTGIARKIGEDGVPEQKVKWINIVNNEDNGIVERIEPRSTGVITISIAEEDENTITAFSRSNTEWKPKNLDWVPADASAKLEYMKKIVKSVEIAQAGQNISATDQDKHTVPWSLKRVKGIIATRRIGISENEQTHAQREWAIISLTDKSVAANPNFFKAREVADPKDPTKKIKQYGGFSVFVDPEEIRNIDKGSEVEIVGHISDAHQMQGLTVIPTPGLTFAPKKPTEKLQRPNTTAPAVPPVNAPSAGAI